MLPLKLSLQQYLTNCTGVIWRGPGKQAIASALVQNLQIKVFVDDNAMGYRLETRGLNINHLVEACGFGFASVHINNSFTCIYAQDMLSVSLIATKLIKVQECIDAI